MVHPKQTLPVAKWLLPPFSPHLFPQAPISGLVYTLRGPPDQALLILTPGPLGLPLATSSPSQ